MCVCLTVTSKREEVGNWTSCCPATTFREAIRGETKWEMGLGGGDLGCGREKRNGLRKFLMTCCIRPFSLEDSFRAKWYKNPGTKDLATLFYRLDGVSKGSVM